MVMLVVFIYPSDSWDNIVGAKHRAIVTKPTNRDTGTVHRHFFLAFSAFYNYITNLCTQLPQTHTLQHFLFWFVIYAVP